MSTPDLFGWQPPAPEGSDLPEESRAPSPTHKAPPSEKMVMAAWKRKIAAAVKKFDGEDTQLQLCTDTIELLRRPIISIDQVPAQYRLKRAKARGFLAYEKFDVRLFPETGDEVDPDLIIDIPYVPWGPAWIVDENQMSWSKESITFLQHTTFWESLTELALHYNEPEKWAVLRWVFEPPVVRQYVWDPKLGRSHCLATNSRDHPFSFHNCALAAGMNADVVREGIKRNIGADLYTAVQKVVTY